MLMTLHVVKSGSLQHCLALQGGCQQTDALGQCTVTLYISEAPTSGRTVISTCSQGDSLVTALLVGPEMGLLHMQVHLGSGAVGALCSTGHSGVWP